MAFLRKYISRRRRWFDNGGSVVNVGPTQRGSGKSIEKLTHMKFDSERLSIAKKGSFTSYLSEPQSTVCSSCTHVARDVSHIAQSPSVSLNTSHHNNNSRVSLSRI